MTKISIGFGLAHFTLQVGHDHEIVGALEIHVNAMKICDRKFSQV